MLPAALRRPVIRMSVKSRALVQGAVRSFRERTEGVAAVEFALILPIMAVMMIGSIEMSQAVSVDRRVSQVATATGDLVARIETDIKDSEIKDIGKIGSWMMKPFDEDKLKVTLSLVTVPCPATGSCSSYVVPVNDPKMKRRWQCVYKSLTPDTIPVCTCPTAAYTMPSAGLIKGGDAVILAEVEYKYQPKIFDFFMNKTTGNNTGIYTLTEKVHLKSRGTCTKLTYNNDTQECKCFD
jgi:Flp pilus assembly protein TadG